MTIRVDVKGPGGHAERLNAKDDVALARLIEQYGERVVSIEIGGRCNTRLGQWTQGTQIIWCGNGPGRAWGVRGYLHFTCRGSSLPELLAVRNALRDE